MSKYLPQWLIALLLICLSIQMGSAATLQADANTHTDRLIGTALERYRQIDAQGGWPQIAPGPLLRLDSRSECVLSLRHRLRATGELPPLGQLSQVGSETTNFDADMIFDHEVDQAVRQIQRRYGLHVDGIVGRKTLAALNVPVQDRIRQLQQDLEHGHLPEDLGDRYIRVVPQ
ncbi:hypothetical protein C2W62_25780 [Candidatus Entotheonella serta]|nr:hypothetical protein C2W62_25780 [Candidatus Entotheonella serta]